MRMNGVSSSPSSLCHSFVESYGFACNNKKKNFAFIIVVFVLFEVQTNKFSILLDYLRTRTKKKSDTKNNERDNFVIIKSK